MDVPQKCTFLLGAVEKSPQEGFTTLRALDAVSRPEFGNLKPNNGLVSLLIG